MEQYISKDAIVAEIKRRKELVSDPILSGDDLMIGERNAYFNLLTFIDTIEVKEVDLEKEFSQWWKGERAKDYNVDILYERYSNVSIKLAKHFFELGMSVNNKAQKGEKV